MNAKFSFSLKALIRMERNLPSFVAVELLFLLALCCHDFFFGENGGKFTNAIQKTRECAHKERICCGDRIRDSKAFT